MAQSFVTRGLECRARGFEFVCWAGGHSTPADASHENSMPTRCSAFVCSSHAIGRVVRPRNATEASKVCPEIWKLWSLLGSSPLPRCSLPTSVASPAVAGLWLSNHPRSPPLCVRLVPLPRPSPLGLEPPIWISGRMLLHAYIRLIRHVFPTQ